jgi:phosphoribosyl 1,2-cyclic phosphate phosphodiesterase
LTFLGTGTSQGIPVVGCQCAVCRSLDFRDKRLRTSVHLDIEGKSFIIDSGPDFRQQVLQNRISHLDALLFTHEHKDHTAGMDDIRGFNFIQGKPVPIYARERVIRQLRQEFAYVFAEEKYPGVPEVDVHFIENQPFDIGPFTFHPIEVMHHKLPVFGFRVGNLAYITDANHIPEAEKDKIQGVEVLVLNALRYKKHISHYNVEEALELVEELRPQQTYFTHISHQLGLHEEVSKMLPGHVALAYDGLQVEVSGF